MSRQGRLRLLVSGWGPKDRATHGGGGDAEDAEGLDELFVWKETLLEGYPNGGACGPWRWDEGP